jgi:hypothetical protein
MRVRHRQAALPELRRRGATIIVAILERPVIEKIPTHFGLDRWPQPGWRCAPCPCDMPRIEVNPGIQAEIQARAATCERP